MATTEFKRWTVVFDDDTEQPHTKCPHCGALDTIEEHDTAVRWNRLALAPDGKSAIAHTGPEGDWEADGWICSSCVRTIESAPKGFEIVDWI